MSSGLRESKSFARRQRRKRLFKYTFILAVFVGLGLLSYETGGRLAELEVRQARQDIARLTSARAALEQETAALRTAVETERKSRAELQRRYDKDVPTGERKALFALVEQQLGEGAKADRLRFLIAAAGNEEKCDGQPVTKRFIVRTPLYEGANSAVSFADSALTVTAMGESQIDAQGLVQAWFDPAKPVNVELARLGEKPATISGKLPLHHALVGNGFEYRLSFLPADLRGFVNVTADRCRFP
jgi:hypothetical protein